MKKVIAIEFVSLDGVIQAPGGPDEDTSGGFAHGGWIRPYADPVQSAVIRQQMGLPFDLLLGRTTFEIWAPYWPQHPNVWPGVQTATKYVASTTLTSHAWGPSVFLGGDVAGQVAELMRQPGPDLHVIREREPSADAARARPGRRVLVEDPSDHARSRQAAVRGRRDPGDVPGDGEPGHLDGRHPRELRAGGRDPDRLWVRMSAVPSPPYARPSPRWPTRTSPRRRHATGACPRSAE